MKKLVFTIIIFAIIAVSNYYSGYIIFRTEGLFQYYHFQSESGDFQFRAMPSKGRDLEMMERRYQSFLEKNPDKKREKIYRTFRANPLKFWKWYYYLTDKMYQFDYKKRI